MSRDPYRSSTGDLGFMPPRVERWDKERLSASRDLSSRGSERDRFEERDTRVTTIGRGSRIRDHSMDDIYDRQAPPREDYVRERVHYEDGPDTHFGKDFPIRTRPRRRSIIFEKEKEKEYYRSPSPPAPPRRVTRPGMLRRQSSLDTYDRKPLPRYYEREEYGPLPGRVREREIIRRRRRSRSSSSSSSEGTVATREFPRKGKTRMPAKLVSKRAIIDLGYSYEDEGTVIVIQQALGRENINEIIELSRGYKSSESKTEKSDDKVIEERRTTTYIDNSAPAAAEIINVSPLPVNTTTEIVRKEIFDEHDHRSRSRGAHAHYTGIVESSNSMGVGPLALAEPHHHHHRDTRDVRREIRALEAEQEALRAERHAEHELRRADLIREGRSPRASGELVIYEEERGEPVVEIRRDRRGRMSMAVPAKYR